MKLRLLVIIGFLAIASCKKEKTDSLTLLTKKTWKPTKSLGTIANISTFQECELGDSYAFGANGLSITPSADNCNGIRSFTNFNYTVDFNSNTITASDQRVLNISKLTKDSLVIYHVIVSGAKRQYVLVH